MLLLRPKSCFSAISNDLLLSLSMGYQQQAIKSQKQLADYFKLSNIITNDDLYDAFSLLDRKLFASKTLSQDKLYGNNAIELNDNDNMTTPIMHAFPSNIIINQTKQDKNIRLLDAGTGKGYIAFLMFLALQKQGIDFEIIGIDDDTQLIEECQKLQKVIFKELGVNQMPNQKLKFEPVNIYAEQWQFGKFDYINVGFGMDEQNFVTDKLNTLNQNAFGIVPLWAGNEQWLTKISLDGKQERMMKCLFQEAKPTEQLNASSKQWQENKLQEFKNQEKKFEDIIINYKKDFEKTHGKKVSLKDMQKNEQMVSVLKELRIAKLNIKKIEKMMKQ